MESPCGSSVVVYNGEIYNDAVLRSALERDHGATFRGRCDAEILPQGWIAHGTDLVDMLEGMYAFAVWDRRTRTLTLARDPLGIKPLFVYETPNLVAFASELKALLPVLSGTVEIDPVALHGFLAQGYASPHLSLVRGIRQVPPGTIDTFSATSTDSRKFWRPRRTVRIREMGEALDAFDALWPTVVEEHLVSDTPVGVLLSGGIDSNLVAATLPRSSEAPLFTASFHAADWDESELARNAASALTRPLVEERIDDASEDLVGRFRAVAAAADGQLADASGFAFFAISRVIAERVKVALSGDGGDELFAGYDTYRASRLAAAVGAVVPATLASRVGSRLAVSPSQAGGRYPHAQTLGRFLLGVSGSPATAHVEWRRHLFAHEAEGIYTPALRQATAGVDPLGDYRNAFEAAEGSVLDRCLIADQVHYLPGDLLRKSDAHSMAHGLEVRVPFLDRRVVEFANSLDGRLLQQLTGPKKRVLRAYAARKGVPDEVVSGPKRGFNVPLGDLLRGPLRPLGDEVFGNQADILDSWLRPDGLASMWKRHRDGRADHSYALWTLLTLAVWARTVL